MWAWAYNAKTTTYTGETVDINDAGASDVSLPPVQTATMGDTIYIGGTRLGGERGGNLLGALRRHGVQHASITTSPLGDHAWLFLEKVARATYEHVIE